MLYIKKKGSVGYTVVGTPTIVDGVVSGFSGSSYVQSSTTFPGSTATSLEFATKFNISSFASTSTIVSSTSGTIPFHLAVRDSKFRLYPGRENTYKVGDFVLSANTDYFIKLFWDSTNGWKLQYSTDGTNYITDFENYNPSDSAPKDNYIIFGRNYPNGGQEGLLGTLDLNNTYIKIDGQPWFGICPVEVKKHQIMGPVGYTVVGSPTITDGVVSGMSNSNYTKTSLSFLSDYKANFDIVICAKKGSVSSQGKGVLFTMHNGISTQGKFACFFWGNNFKFNSAIETGYSDAITLTATFDSNTFYYLKVSQRNRTVTLSYSTDGVTWQGETSLNDFSQIWSSFPIDIGRNLNWASGFAGEIDLNNTYIKVNGKLWFWQPRETERILVNGVEVWNKNGV